MNDNYFCWNVERVRAESNVVTKLILCCMCQGLDKHQCVGIGEMTVKYPGLSLVRKLMILPMCICIFICTWWWCDSQHSVTAGRIQDFGWELAGLALCLMFDGVIIKLLSQSFGIAFIQCLGIHWCFSIPWHVYSLAVFISMYIL